MVTGVIRADCLNIHRTQKLLAMGSRLTRISIRDATLRRLSRSGQARSALLKLAIFRRRSRCACQRRLWFERCTVTRPAAALNSQPSKGDADTRISGNNAKPDGRLSVVFQAIIELIWSRASVKHGARKECAVNSHISPLTRRSSPAI